MEYGAAGSAPGRGPVARLATETKQAFKTTEFWVYVVLVFAVLIAGTVDDAEGTQFGADNVWLYVTLLTVGYLISRGLAKSGSHDPYWEQPGAQSHEGGVAERVKAAAQVLKDGDTTTGPTSQHPAEGPVEGSRY